MPPLRPCTESEAELTGDRRQEVETATETFKSEVADVRKELVTSVSLNERGQQIQTALKALASSYEAALAPIDCS